MVMDKFSLLQQNLYKSFYMLKSVLRQENESIFEVTLDRPAAAAGNFPSN